jgi:hypothetical protein
MGKDESRRGGEEEGGWRWLGCGGWGAEGREGEEFYFAAFANMVRTGKLDCCIVSDPAVLNTLVKSTLFL